MGVPPAICTPLVVFECPEDNLATVKFPKSAALPSEAISKESITSDAPGVKPPPLIPLVTELYPAAPLLPTLKSPKSEELPKTFIFTNSMVLTVELPPEKNALPDPGM